MRDIVIHNENCLDIIGIQNVYIDTSYFIHKFIPITINTVTSKTLSKPYVNQRIEDILDEDVSYLYTFSFQRYFILVCVNLSGMYF